MKKLTTLLALMMVFVLCLGVFTACSSTEDDTDEDDTSTSDTDTTEDEDEDTSDEDEDADSTEDEDSDSTDDEESEDEETEDDSTTVDSLVEVTAINDDGTYDVLYYTSNAGNTEFTISDYTAVDTSEYYESAATDTLTIDDSVEIYTVSSSALASATTDDIEEGSMLVLTYTDDVLTQVVIY